MKTYKDILEGVKWGFLKPANKEFSLNLRMTLAGGYKGKSSIEKWAGKHIKTYGIKNASDMEEFTRVVHGQVTREKNAVSTYIEELVEAMWDIIDG
jgi:hypothetical protein